MENFDNHRFEGWQISRDAAPGEDLRFSRNFDTEDVTEVQVSIHRVEAQYELRSEVNSKTVELVTTVDGNYATLEEALIEAEAACKDWERELLGEEQIENVDSLRDETI